MHIHDILKTRRDEAIEKIETLKREVSEIERAMKVLGEPTPQEQPPRAEGYMTKDDAIIEALKAGHNTPAMISDFIRTKLNIPVNPASTRTRLSRMKADGKIKHDGIGWKLD